jgi:hypothetical protein
MLQNIYEPISTLAQSNITVLKFINTLLPDHDKTKLELFKVLIIFGSYQREY